MEEFISQINYCFCRKKEYDNDPSEFAQKAFREETKALEIIFNDLVDKRVHDILNHRLPDDFGL